MKKKLISAVLCAALAVTSIASASAASSSDIANSGLNLDNFDYPKSVVGEVIQPNNYAILYQTSENANPRNAITFIPNTGEATILRAKDCNPTASAYLPDPDGYRYMAFSGGNIRNRACFTNAGGAYERIRIKLSDFSNYFNDDGTHTKSFFGGEPHDYNFTKEDNGIYSSNLMFFSGGALTSTAPDSNGMVEIYVSTKLGVETKYIADFSESRVGVGGGASGTAISSLTIGNVDNDSSVMLFDALEIQKYAITKTGFNSLAQRNADVDRNGKINLLDAINVQKYVLKLY